MSPTKKFLDEVKAPLADALVEQVTVAEPAMLRKPLAELLETVRTEEATYTRGVALEGVAIAVLRLMGARFRTWRKNPSETGQAEVDLTADFVNGRYQVLQVQCKVSPIKTREVVDREVGVMLTVLANTILFISARDVGAAARRAADEYMRINAVSIIFLDGSDLDALAEGGSIARPLGREFRHVEAIKTRSSSALS